jgi:hypothetical protein
VARDDVASTFGRAGKTNHAFRARISPENGGIGRTWQAKRKRLTSFSGDSYNLRFVSAMTCGTVPGTGIRKTIYFKE